MRFGMDLDGVIADFSSQVVTVINTIWPGRVPSNYVPKDWDYADVLSKEDWQMVWASIKTVPFFWEDEPSLPGSDELVEFLQNRRQEKSPHYRLLGRLDDIYFITARAHTVGASPLTQSSRWLAARGLWPRDGASTVIPVQEARHKCDLFRALGLKFMLDDYAPTVEQLNAIEGMHAFVLDQPWNRYATHLPRVYSVTEYLEAVERES